MIITQDLSKNFGDFQAVDGVNLQVGEGELLALLGPNGAGKTTTVRMLTSVLAPSRGTAQIAGYDVIQQSAQVRASVGVLTEHHGLYNRMPAIDYLKFYAELYGMDESVRQRKADELLDQFGLGEDRNRRIGEFSKGMRQKLALARALIHTPPVLLLDEPTSAMDPESSRLVRDAIRTLRSEDRAIVICTHNLIEAEDLADRIAIIRRGKIIANGTIQELKNQLLGAAEYEVRLSSDLNGQDLGFPEGVTLTGQGQNWLRFQTPEPEIYNSAVLRALLDLKLSILSLREVPRSLEKVYLKAVSVVEHKEVSNG